MINEHKLPNVALGDLGLANPSINANGECPYLADKTITKKLRRNHVWNMFVFSFCYFLTYTGFWSLANLQSTMNAEGGLGDYSQAAIYICSMLSSLFLPKALIEKWGCKNILVAGSLICCLYIGSNMYLRWDFMMSASILYGLINGPFVSAQTFYVDEMATRFQSTISENLEFIMAAFFGMFMFFSENTQVWGNVIAYYALSSGRPLKENTTLTSQCGANFSPLTNDTNKNLDPPTEKERFILTGAYLSMSLLSVVIMAVFLEPLKNDLKEGSGCRTMVERFVSAFKQLKNPHQMLLVFISIYIGMEGPFYGNEFTEVRQEYFQWN
ncbi:protein unc-93 homolog A [Caerostris extrusa]|uniref:Protein unc-93 homolog A n=1 Tax=Caerostris extrusa TaxID=172846 RepID=A0AAV4QA73_CAEEX|nr:protein unc-93 homolog A [Caerostris extrusa]